MSIKTGRNNKSLDWITLAVYLSLLIIGWLMLYAAVYNEDQPYAFLYYDTVIGRQTIWIGVSLLVFILFYSIDWKFWNTFAFPIYAFTMILLLLVLIVGVEIKGARSWFSVFGFSFQPSELAKFGTALAVSLHLSSYKSNIKHRQTLLISLGLILLPIVLILLQPDAGSAIVFLSFFVLFYRRGLSVIYYILGFSIAAIFITSLIYDPKIVTLFAILIGLGILIYNFGQTWRSGATFLLIALVSILFYVRDLYWWGVGLSLAFLVLYSLLFVRDRNFKVITLVLPSVVMAGLLAFGSSFAFNKGLEPHQQDRINVWLRPEKSDPHGSRYNITQSKIAIGSGGLQGKGFLKGDMTNLNYVPEQTTDFIFSTVGEEQGFLGSVGIIFLFTLLMVRMVAIGERGKNAFICNFAYSAAGILFIHVLINVGMAIGLMPVIGIPLPFLSKGGSALVGFTILIAVLLRMDRARLGAR